jgi:hypothetical protein
MHVSSDRGRPAWRRLAVTGLLVASTFAACLGGSSDREPAPVGRGDCVRLRDRLAELRVDTAVTGSQRSAMADAFRHSMGDEFVDRCIAEVPRSQLDCTLKARSMGDATACVPGASASEVTP